MISVILPTYNRADWLPQSIRSIMEQDYRNWELIIVDDCSSDTTGDVVREFMEQDGRIKYIGRNDNQVKIRGFRVELEEIEKQLLNCPDVTKAVVYPVENNNLTKSLVAFIETKRPSI